MTDETNITYRHKTISQCILRLKSIIKIHLKSQVRYMNLKLDCIIQCIYKPPSPKYFYETNNIEIPNHIITNQEEICKKKYKKVESKGRDANNRLQRVQRFRI